MDNEDKNKTGKNKTVVSLIYAALSIVSGYITFCFGQEFIPLMISVMNGFFHPTDAEDFEFVLSVFLAPGAFILTAIFVGIPFILTILFLILFFKNYKK